MDEEKEEKFVNTKTARQLLQVTAVTLRSWDKKGKIKTIRTPSGIRRYSLKSIHNILGCGSNTPSKEKIVYCRVSSPHQKEDLKRQGRLLQTRYPNHKLVKDIGSGINWHRKGLQTILERSMRGELKEVVVAHRDRLSRFAFELIQFILEKNGVKLLVLNQDHEESKEQELAEDILSIIHVFSCRQNGRRRYKIQENKDFSDQITKTNI